MIVAVLVAAVAVAVWIATVLKRVKESDSEVLAFSKVLEDSRTRRAAHLTSVKDAIARVDGTFEQWNGVLEQRTQELQALSARVGRVAVTDRRPEQFDVIDDEPRVVKIVSGRVPRSYAIASLRMTFEDRAPASPQLERSPKETLGLSWRHPVEFIVPTLGLPRPKHSSARSAVAVEDMLASKAVAQALIRGWPEAEVHTRSVDPGSAWDGHGGNICTFCRDRRNPATGVILSHPAIRSRFNVSFPKLESELKGAPAEAGVTLGEGPALRSPSFAQEREVKDRGAEWERAVLDDLAVLARVTNPWDPDGKILIVAGIRAFGTLGAAEFLRTRWDELYDVTGERDFACLVSVRATYQVEVADDSLVVSSEPETLATKAVELVPSEDVPTAVEIVRIEPAA